MKLIDAASNLDLRSWVRGLLSAGISGGASAVSGGTIVGMLAPETFNVHTGKFYILVFGLFASNGLVSIMKFLQQHPLPDMVDVTTAVQTTHMEGSAIKQVTVTETHKEPVEAVKESVQ